MTRRLLLLSVLGTTSIVVACSSTAAPEPYVAPQGDRVTEQVEHACPKSSALLIGTAAAGDACEQGADCAPTCCQCDNGTNYSWLAVHCASKVCAGPTQVCADTDNDGGHCEAAP